jgi:hypothetical protein
VVPDVQTNTPTSLIGPADPNNLVLQISASSNLEHDKGNAIDWRRPIIDYL